MILLNLIKKTILLGIAQALPRLPLIAAATGVLLYRFLFQEKINDYFTITLIGMIMFIITLAMFKLTGIWLFLFLFPGYSFMLTMYAYHKSKSMVRFYSRKQVLRICMRVVLYHLASMD